MTNVSNLKVGDKFTSAFTYRGEHYAPVEWTITRENKATFSVSASFVDPRLGVTYFNLYLSKRTGTIVR